MTVWGSDWTREALVENAVHLAERGFGIVRVYHATGPKTCSCGNPHAEPKDIGKHPIGNEWQKRAEHDPGRVRTTMNNPGNRAYGIIPPDDGTFIWDYDEDAPAIVRRVKEEVHEALPETRVHLSGKGKHVFYRWPADMPRPTKADMFGIVTRWYPGGQVIGPGSVHAETGKVYTVENDAPIAEFPRAWAQAATGTPGQGFTMTAGPVEAESVTVGGRHDALRDIARHYAGTVRDPKALKAAVMAYNAQMADPKSEADVDRAIGDVLTKFPADAEPVELPEPLAAGPEEWPKPPEDAAYHGVLGEIAQTLAPTTEADPVGVLGTLLTMFGLACGGGHTIYQGSLQRANVYTVLVGRTGFGGRKGTGLDLARTVFRRAYPELDGLWLVGVSSGEAIPGHLERNAPEDRILLVETELSRLLTIMGREGSTLSPVLRNAWDGVPVGYARSREGKLVTKHCVALVGHITPIDLRAKLTATDAANGFANRILFLAVRQTQLIPFPTSADALAETYIERLNRAIVEARTPVEMHFDADARDRWEAFYFKLAKTARFGLAGALSARHEAQVARLALIYALADRSEAVGRPHLEAAIALADYARRSVVWAMGDSTGNRHADQLRGMLNDGPVGAREVRTALGLRTAADVAEVIAVLVDARLATVVSVPRAGRPRQEIRKVG
jgi:hypothetical protein